jgi:hypothetical protein
MRTSADRWPVLNLREGVVPHRLRGNALHDPGPKTDVRTPRRFSALAARASQTGSIESRLRTANRLDSAPSARMAAVASLGNARPISLELPPQKGPGGCKSKLARVASARLGVRGRAVLRALVDVTDHSAELSERARGRSRIGRRQALNGISFRHRAGCQGN